MRNMIVHCDVMQGLRQIESDSIDSIITSPPYYQLRDYGFEGQWGLEKTYNEYLDKMIGFMAECRRVIKPTGTIWVNLGDSYSGNKEGCSNPKLHKAVKEKCNIKKKVSDIPNKSLMLIPHRFAIRCIDELGLILRNDIIWAKKNGMPESVTDRFSKKHEFIFFFVRSQKYFFDLDSVRSPVTGSTLMRLNQNVSNQIGSKRVPGKSNGNMKAVGNIESGKNPGDVSDFWDIPTKPTSANHYAAYNTDLIDKPIIAGSPEKGIVLDPFAGTGTTLIRAYELGRDVIGIEANSEYHAMASKRLNEAMQQHKLFE